MAGLVQKGAILGWLGHTMQERIIKIEHRRPTEEEADKLNLYKIQSDSLIDRARSLGWEPLTAESRERYLQTITEAKTMYSK